MTSATIFTRRELADYVSDAFDGGTVGRTDLIRLLVNRNAPPELVTLLGERVPPEARLADLRALWHYLGDMPLDRP